jgi:glycolate oxidase FAD binding subunit
VAEACKILKLAHRSNVAVAPRGGGTKLGWGHPPTRLDLVLTTARLNRLLEHASGDLVARVEAGISLARLQEELAGAGQQLALDPPEQGATVGGIIATNASGSLRLRYGTMRDLLIGITYILPDGTVAKAGGRVVKNVAGYDLNKLFTGSLGTLGLVAEAIVRLHPLPATRRFAAVSVDSPKRLNAAVQSILHSQLVPSALDLAWHSDGHGQPAPSPLLPGPWILTVLFEGIEQGARAQAETAAHLLSRHGEAHVFDEREGQELWQRVTAMPWSSPGDAGLKINHLPARLDRVLQEVLDLANEAGAETRIGGHAGSGVTLVALSGADDQVAGIVEEMRKRVAPDGGSVVVLQAPGRLKEMLDVWGPVGDALPLMRQTKLRFDPKGLMNPGRFVGGI